MNYTTEQSDIITAKDQHILVIANAGVGKSFTIVERVAHLVTAGHTDPSRILMTSFSKVAGRELYDKVVTRVGEHVANNISIGTIHSLCYRIVVTHLDYLKIPKIDIVSEAYLAATVLNKYPNLFESKKMAQKMAAKYRDDLLNRVNTISDVKTYEAFTACQNQLWLQGKYTYDDLMLKAVHLMKAYPEILAFWQNIYDYVFVDEAQDTNAIQWEIIYLLTTDKTHMCVVGDTKQNIYGFRGCSYRYMEEFRKKFNAKVYPLTQTFRFGQAFADISNKIVDILEIDPIYKQHTITKVRDDAKPLLFHLSDFEQQSHILQNIRTDISEGRQYGDISILVRYNREMIPFIKTLIASNIPFELKTGDVFEKQELKLVIRAASLMRHYQLSDCIDLFSMYSDFVGDKTMTTLYNTLPECDSAIKFLNTALNTPIKGIGPAKKKGLEKMLHRLESLNRYTFAMVESGRRPDIRRMAELLEIDDTKFMADDEAKNIDNPSEDRMEFLEFFNESYQTSEYDHILDWYNFVSVNGCRRTEKPKNAVQLKTIHGSKGQSIPVVYLIANRICDRFITTTPEDIADERFVFYVALTRAERKMHIIFANPYGFEFGCIFDEDWQNKYIGYAQLEPMENTSTETSASPQLPSAIVAQLRDNYAMRPSVFTQTPKAGLSIIANSEKAARIANADKSISFWIPISMCGLNEDNTLVLNNWIVEKNNLFEHMEM